MQKNKKAAANNLPISQLAGQNCQDSPETIAEDEIGEEFEILHVRRIVAGNPNTPEPVLARLAKI